MTTYYIAGPMTGIPQFNVPAFNAVAKQLRDRGLDVISPAELDSEEMRKQALASPDGNLAALENGTGETWGDVLARDVKIVADKVTSIVVLPNWEKSRGARLEVIVGLMTGKNFFGLISSTGRLFPLSKGHMRQILRENMP